jgi:hypothetical protein
MNLEQIDTSTTAGKAEVMRLAAEGRRVVRNYRCATDHSQCGWHEVTGKPSWNWEAGDFAIIASDEVCEGYVLLPAVLTSDIEIAIARWLESNEPVSECYAAILAASAIRADLAGEGK